MHQPCFLGWRPLAGGQHTPVAAETWERRRSDGKPNYETTHLALSSNILPGAKAIREGFDGQIIKGRERGAVASIPGHPHYCPPRRMRQRGSGCPTCGRRLAKSIPYRDYCSRPTRLLFLAPMRPHHGQAGIAALTGYWDKMGRSGSPCDSCSTKST